MATEDEEPELELDDDPAHAKPVDMRRVPIIITASKVRTRLLAGANFNAPPRAPHSPARGRTHEPWPSSSCSEQPVVGKLLCPVMQCNIAVNGLKVVMYRACRLGRHMFWMQMQRRSSAWKAPYIWR